MRKSEGWACSTLEIVILRVKTAVVYQIMFEQTNSDRADNNKKV